MQDLKVLATEIHKEITEKKNTKIVGVLDLTLIGQGGKLVLLVSEYF